MGYRKISYKLNEWGIKTVRGKKWFNSSVHSVLKRRNQRVGIIKSVKYVIGLFENKTLPAIGISAKGPSLITWAFPEGSVRPKEKKKLVIPIAAIFITVPAII